MAAPITSEVITAAAGQLGENGYRFTQRQLYYAVCAAVERPPASNTRGIAAFGVILIMLGITALPIHAVPVSAVFWGLGAGFIGMAVLDSYWRRRRQPSSRPLAVGYEEFVSGPLAGSRAADAGGLGSLVEVEPAPPNPDLNPMAIVLVCDRGETAAMLAANAAHLPTGLVVLEEGGPGTTSRPRQLHCLHDADPGGCGLAARLRSGGADVVDIGLQPPASDVGLQVIEGAPARLPGGLDIDLSRAQVDWLRSGRRLELATLPPEHVVRTVIAALDGVKVAGREPAG